jgi:signal transduction histidine kinase
MVPYKSCRRRLSALAYYFVRILRFPQTCQHLKANPISCDIPVIFMTALSDTENKVKALELGAVDYVTKPFQEREVLARVKTHLQLRCLTQKLEQEVRRKTNEIENFQVQLIQGEKMSALGNLVAGVAHEINNPLGFLNGSISNARDYVQDLLDYIALYQQHHPDAAVPIQNKAEEIDLKYLTEDLPKMLGSMEGAIDRVKDISVSLRTFSRADTDCQVSANLHEGIDSTLLILKYRLKANQYRPAIEIIQEYGEIPAIKCFPGQLNQVFMNILANAIDVFDEMAQQSSFDELTEDSQQITICTTKLEHQVQISIRDNGKGMTENVKAKIFDHLFTTKSVGKGTGLGLAIARQIVVEKHGGTLDVQSELDQGSEFCIRLPIGVE